MVPFCGRKDRILYFHIAKENTVLRTSFYLEPLPPLLVRQSLKCIGELYSHDLVIPCQLHLQMLSYWPFDFSTYTLEDTFHLRYFEGFWELVSSQGPAIPTILRPTQ